MAGGYRCSLGHAWNPPDGAAVLACPVCGDTTIITVVAEARPAAFVLAAGAAPAGGQDETQSLPLPQPDPEHAATVEVEFTPEAETTGGSSGADTPDSFSSLVVLLPEGQGDSPSSKRSGGSSIVPFGHLDTIEFKPPLVPGYEIVAEVGRGGMGVVYKARQVSLNRLVALKMILSGSHAGPSERERFRREAESVAALAHPHIVQIFDIGEADGHPYLALEFVEGGSLAQQLDGQPWEASRAAELVEVLARTMQFAHDAGIVHRDLKPGNILLGNAECGSRTAEWNPKAEDGSDSAFRNPHSAIKVTDFGLAKRLDETLGPDGGTRTGAVLGTPSYIAPEQAGGKTADVGPPTDVYALGAILYELLTGRPPFRGETPLDTVLQVLHDDPVTPKRLHPLVPRDLETICLKCLAKKRAARYASAAALADDLRRFLRGEPIQARPLSAWGRTVKWARRHPALAVLMGATVAATVALVAVLSVAYFRVRDAVSAQEHEKLLAQRERDRAEQQKKIAEELAAENARRRADAEREARERQREAESARRAAYALQLSQVAILCERDPLRAAVLLEDETRCPKDLRDFTWYYLRRLCQRDDHSYLDHQPDDPLRAVAYSPQSAFVATAGEAGTIRLWDPRSGRTWLTLTGHIGAIHALTFSPDGTIVAAAGADRSVRLWVLPVETLALAESAVNRLRWLEPLVAPMVKPPALAPTVTLGDAHDGAATCVAFSPDGRALVSGGQDGLLRWWDLTAWRPAPVDVAGLGGAAAVAVSLARATQTPDARKVWSPRKWRGHTNGVLCLAFAQNGQFLVSGGADRQAKVWAGHGLKLERTLPRHADVVRAVAITPDGGTVATVNNPAGDNQPPTIRLFDTQNWRERRLFGHTKSIHALEISADGELLASAGFDKTVRLWGVADGREHGILSGHAQLVSALAFAPDRHTLVSAGMDGTAIVWQTSSRTHEPGEVLQFSRDQFGKLTAQGLTAAAIGGGGASILTADDAGGVLLLATDLTSAARRSLPGAPGSLVLTPLAHVLPLFKTTARAAAVSPDGRTFVVAVDGGLRVWRPDPSGGRPLWPGTPRVPVPARSMFARTPAPVHALCIDPTSRWIATADTDAVRLYDLADIPAGPQLPVDLKGGTIVLAAADARELTFHPTRPLLAVAVGTGLRVVSLDGQALDSVPRGHSRIVNGSEVTPKVESLAFDAAGKQLATGDASGLIKLWKFDDAGRLSFLRDLPGHTGPVYALAFSPDGLTLASGGDDRAVILWDPIAQRERLALTGHADRVLRLVFKPDGSALVTLGRDGAVKRWRADLRAAQEPLPRLPQPLMLK